jgi:hypothetical protein
MATVFLPFHQLFAAFQALAAWLAPRPAPALRPAVRTVAVPQGRPAPRPLRVVRVMEPAAAGHAAGRMVISGRLADVCAELERLAAQEARGR